ESKVYIAKMAEQAERFEEMVSATKSIAKMGVDLTVEERSLLSVAYKNVVGARRASWKIISSIEQKETDEQNLSLIRTYLVKVEKELSDVCREIISLLGTYLIPSAAEAEPKVFYLKMHGDYWRYLAEVANGDERKVTASARSLARSLSLPHTVLLSVCMRFGVDDNPHKRNPGIAGQGSWATGLGPWPSTTRLLRARNVAPQLRD
ncbi:MAG: 14-3-3 family protein, partial [Promethearchaeia archaeon]